MKRLFSFSALVIVLSSCQQVSFNKHTSAITERNIIQHLHSKNVNDDYNIFIRLPDGYNAKKHYPVVYLLDANFYFDMVAAMTDKYTEVDAIPPVIVVGIGYKDLKTMAELRDRDYTYPTAPPSDSFKMSGGGVRFLSFINTELIPYIDSAYSTDKQNRILAGHSLGGYFTLYALQQQLKTHRQVFSTFIAGSPSVNYNHYALLSDVDTTTPASPLRLYVTYGQQEDEENKNDKPVPQPVASDLQAVTKVFKGRAHIHYESDLFSNLGHMDTPLPTFHKGLLWALGE